MNAEQHIQLPLNRLKLDPGKNTTNDNPWNAAYKLAMGKIYTNTQITTLKKPDGCYTADTKKP